MGLCQCRVVVKMSGSDRCGMVTVQGHSEESWSLGGFLGGGRAGLEIGLLEIGDTDGWRMAILHLTTGLQIFSFRPPSLSRSRDWNRSASDFW